MFFYSQYNFELIDDKNEIFKLIDYMIEWHKTLFQPNFVTVVQKMHK